MPKFISQIIIILYLFTSCTDLFSTRKAEQPDSGSTSGIYEEATQPEIVIRNFTYAIEQKNTSEYSDIFPDQEKTSAMNFNFVPDPGLVDKFKPPWTYEDEKNYFNNLVFPSEGKSPTILFQITDTLSYRPINPLALDDSLETNLFHYSLKLVYTDTTTYQGLAQFRLYKSKDKELWYIYYWKDLAVDENIEQSWSYLKLLNR